MNTQKSVFKKLSAIEKVEDKVELSEQQRVELARKPQSILNDLKKLDSKMRTQEDKMSKAYNNYRAAQKEFVSFMNDAISQADSAFGDIGRVMDSASELGVTDFSTIDGLSEAQDLSMRLQDIAKDAKKLYPSIN